MKRLLVTGGMGFIGSNFILYMLERYSDYIVYNFDALTYAGNKENLAQVEHAPNYQFVHGDITDTTRVDEVMAEGIDYVVHFAAESHVDRSILDPHRFVHTNMIGTHILLESAQRHGIKRFIHISTDEVYGSLGPTGYFTESTPLSPNSPYSASKAGSDLIARSYYETFRFPVIITRCSNNYGPYQYPEKFIPLVITQAVLNRDIPIYGDGLNIRDWLYVKDHCQAIDAALHNGEPGKVYNIGGNQEFHNIEIASRILNELGKSNTLLKFVSDRPGHDRRYAINATKIFTELGWKPSYSFETGLKATLDWYMNHQEWWRRLLSGDDKQGKGIRGG